MYTVDYFIAKFEAIPANKWIKYTLNNENGSCALGHCGLRGDQYIEHNKEAHALHNLFVTNLGMNVAEINDGTKDEYLETNPKERILAALRDIKAIQERREIANIDISEVEEILKQELITENV